VPELGDPSLLVFYLYTIQVNLAIIRERREEKALIESHQAKSSKEGKTPET
jgi:hypothetical protein